MAPPRRQKTLYGPKERRVAESCTLPQFFHAALCIVPDQRGDRHTFCQTKSDVVAMPGL